MALILLLKVFLAHLIAYYLYSLLRNYHSARKTGLRLVISPLTPYTLRWQLAAALFGPVLRQFRWFRAIDWTCAWKDDDKLHRELGECFIVVSPGRNVLCTSDPTTIEHVLRKWRDFVKPDNVNEILGTFGQNVDTSNGDDWIRHRKLTAPCFSERASAIVWSESLQQSEVLLAKWLSSPSKENTSIIKDTSTLALNVISSVAFENHQVNKPAAGHTLSLRDSLVTVMSTSISPALEGIMPWLKAPDLHFLLPASVKNLLVAMAEFRQYMDETVAREREKPVPSEETRGHMNLINTLIRASNDINDAKPDATQTKARLSDVELRGNIFIFTVGGLETTSITLSYALALLAVYPDVQDWVVEEIDEVSGHAEELEYVKVFPKLKRVMAIMYETLRVYGPSPPIPRAPTTPNLIIPMSSPTSSSASTSNSSTITLPPNTQLMLNSWARHSSASHFPNPKVWDPKRWIESSSTPTSSQLADEKLLHPTSDSGFYAWGAGPRICPGMKFSQVEFCAVMSRVVGRVRVRVDVGVVDGHGEGGGVDKGDADREDREKIWEKEKDKVLSVLNDSCAEPLLLHVREAEKLRVGILER